jgi:tryptophan 2-monooxygenase
MYVNSPVTRLNKLSNGTIEVYTGGSTTPAVVANYVVVTAPIWANQLSIEFDGFNDHTELPWQVPAAIQQQHIIASCKVFFPLTKAYWVAPSSIPQVIVTDTFVQDAYGVNWSSNTNDAAILASYTWEDDASKLLPTNNNDLAAMVLGELDRITNDTLGQPISPFVISSGAQVLQWSMQPTYRGCAKLYRQRNWTACYDLLAYNQTYSATSNLYFAGESYGVEGGWTEPALRTAMDAVIHLINNSHGTFLNGFTFNDYPLYDTTFVPDENYPQTSGA